MRAFAMARPKEFDVDVALRSALEVFWQKGYEATSMQNLVAAMGIQKASLYGTYGDKHELYVQALRSYQRESLAGLEQRLTAPGSPKAAIAAFLLGVAAQSRTKKGKRGCFCVNANIELAPHDPQVATLLRQHSELVERLFAAALRRARSAGELPVGADCGQLATFLFGIVIAINVLGKQAAGRDRMTALARQALAALDA